MKNIHQRMSELTPEKRKLLQQLLLDSKRTASSDNQHNIHNDDKKIVDSNDKKEMVEEKQRNVNFSIIFFSSGAMVPDDEKYEMVIDLAKHADAAGYTAVWTPERHFNEFGSLYPNPSVLAAALAMVTKNIELRAGSVVVPIHHPLRIAEEWSVVDNLSKGRAAISCAIGWARDDFVFSPENYKRRAEVTIENIKIIQKLWRGGSHSFSDIDKNKIELKSYPRPVSSELQVWLTASSNPETFILAGTEGYNLLTAFTGQGIEQLKSKIALYRNSLIAAGYAPDSRKVAVMLHTYLGQDLLEVKNQVRPYMKKYLSSNLELHRNMARSRKINDDIHQDDEDYLLEYAFERYFNESSLLGTLDTSKAMVDKLIEYGVDEIACLVDFGLPHINVKHSMHILDLLKACYSNNRNMCGI